MAVLSVNMVTVTVLLSVFFLSGALAACPDGSALLITAPQEMEALTGSCLQIPCNFRAEPEQEFENRGEIIGVWIKNDPRFGNKPENVIFNSSRTNNKYPMNITGNLNQKNCTTLFSSLITQYTDTYFFRIESRRFNATASCAGLHITVRDSPPSPRIQISGDLKEVESVNITCSAPIPCPHSPPKLTWNLRQDPHNKIEENTDGTFTTKIQETITLTDRHDGSSITCSARYPVGEGGDAKTAEDTRTLNVSYAPKDTSASISPSGSVSAGSWVNLTCSSRAKPPARFTWFNKTSGGAMKVSEGDFYSFNATDEGVYYCVATNDLGNQTSSEIHLSVQDAPKDTSASISPSGSVSAGSWVKLTCSSRAKPPARFTWFTKTSGGAMKVSEGAFYSFNATDEGVYYCVATNDVGDQTSPEIHLSVNVTSSGEPLPWEPVLGGISGILVVICLIVCVCFLKSKHPTAQQTQSQTGEELTRDTDEENIHYGEINFPQLRPEPSSASLQDSGQKQDVVYAQVRVSQRANSSIQTADGPEDLYAQVKKK